MNVTFIGLGIMGSRMAANLLKDTISLTVCNRSEEPAMRLEKQGATRAATCREAVDNADTVITMLPTPEVIDGWAQGDDGFLAAMPRGATWIDCSTVNPSYAATCSRRADEFGIRYLDAPVAGTKGHAEKAALTFLVGGKKEDVERVDPLLHHMGQQVIHVGAAGSGSSLKMLVNNMLGQAMAVFAESLALGLALGLDRSFLLDTLPKLPVAAPFLQAKADLIADDDLDAHFPLEWMYKDLHLLSQTAYEHNQPVPLASLAKELYAQANRNGFGRQDFAAIFKLLDVPPPDAGGNG